MRPGLSLASVTLALDTMEGYLAREPARELSMIAVARS